LKLIDEKQLKPTVDRVPLTLSIFRQWAEVEKPP